MLIYNIDFEVSAAAFLIVLNIYIRLQYPSDSESNKHFKRLALILLAPVVLDVLTAVTISFYESVPVWLNVALNTLFFLSDIFMEFQFVLYCTCATYGTIRGHIIPRIAGVVAIICTVLIIANIFTGWVFSFGENGYTHGPIYLLVNLIPFAVIFVTCGMMLTNFPKFRTSQRISIILYILVVLSGPVIQLFFPEVLFILFTVAIGLLLLMFAMETPDFQALNRTMNELRITRDEAEEAMAVAQSASQAKTDFLSTMSHEIRTPINAILGYNEMVQRESDNPEIAKYSSNIRSAGKALLTMISDMMDFTEMETGSFRIEEVNYSTASMLSDIVTCGRYFTDKKSLELKVSIDPQIPRTLSGDSVRITRIFSNLLSNASKFTDSGWVEISVKWEPCDDGSGFLRACVRDTGIGMKEKDIAHISSSFLRMDRKRNQNIQGIGLGLTIVTRLLSMMGSSLEVSSEYGKGTTMSFGVKQGVVDPEPPENIDALTGNVEKIRSTPGFIAPKARILAVDDNILNLELYKGSLKDTRVQLDTAVNGVEALELISRNHYDLVILDHMMPVMDGMETMKTIKKQNLCPGVPIIVITANAVSSEKATYLNAGFDDYLSKPVSGRQLWEAVRKHLPERLISSEEKNITQTNSHRSILGRLGEFLDIQAALQYCCESEELYLQILGTYIEEDKTSLIKQCCDIMDIDNYRIQVHALKSTSRTIGATSLSEEAMALEEAAKNKDTSYISENTGSVLEKYSELMSRIRGILEQSPSEKKSPEASGRVLYVEDDIMYRYLVERMLQESFGKVTSVQSGEEALEYLSFRQPEVILLDLNLGGMDGLSVLKALKSDGRLCGIPVVIFSSDDATDTQVRCFREGASDFIAKPANMKILSERLKRFVFEETLG